MTSVPGAKTPIPRKALTLREKILLIKEHETKKTTLRNLALQFGVGKTQVSDILKNKNELLEEWAEGANNSECYERRRRTVSKQLRELNNVVVQWLQENWQNNILPSVPDIQQKAREIANYLGQSNFTPTKSWLMSLLKKNGIHYSQYTGLFAYDAVQVEIGDVDFDENGTDREAGKVIENVPDDSNDYSKVNDFLRQMYGKNQTTGNQPEDDIMVIDTVGDRSQTPTATPKQVPKVAKKRKKITEGSATEGETGSGAKKVIVPIISKVTFAEIAGNQATLEEICKLLIHMKHPEVYDKLGISPPRGFLLHGPPGCGKTLLAHAIAGELQLPFFKVVATELVSGISGESEEKIRELFESAAASAPSVIFLDEIDAITPKREVAQREMERRIVAQLLTCMDDLGGQGNSAPVLVVGATNRPDSLDPALRRAGRFDREVTLGIPDVAARQSILRVVSRQLRLEESFDWGFVVSNTPGFVGADLMALTREAAMVAVNRVFEALRKQQDINAVDSDRLQRLLDWIRGQRPLGDEDLENLYVTTEDFREALKNVQPSAQREGFATVPGVTWEDVGALGNVRQELHLAILAPVRYAEQFESLGLSSPSGVLLCGPPGCGKTLLAKAVANEAGINFISVKGPELLNMYVGESERAVRQCFQRARNSAPCVIFFDEIDALCPRRSDHGDGGSSARVVNQLLTEMDGVEARRGVFLMAATNRVDIVDPAVLRPGRLDKILHVGFPTAVDRVDIFKALTKNGTKPLLASDVSLLELGMLPQLDGYTGADLAAIVKESAVQALQEFVFTSGSSWVAGEPIVVHKRHFEVALAKIRPSVSEKDRKRYVKLAMSSAGQFGEVATGDGPSGPLPTL